MAATEASAAPVVQEDGGKTPESKPNDAAEQPTENTNGNSETVNSEVVEKDGAAVNSEVVENKETVNNDTAAVTAPEEGDAAAAAASGEAAPPSENASSSEPKTSFLDSFLNKSGLGKVMGGRKKKEQSGAAAGEENAAAVPEAGEKEAEKGGEEAAAEGGAEGGAEGDEKASENGEKEEDKKGKPAEAKSTVRDLIRKPVARIFSHRSTEKKDGAATEPNKPVKVRSKSLDRLDPEALNTTADSTVEEGGAAGEAEGAAEGGAEGEQKAAAASTTKHMKRWHSFKKLMAQKAHKKSGGAGVGEDVKEEDGEGGGDSSTLDSKESGQKRWKLKRSWTFQGLKRDPSMVGISGKAKGGDKDADKDAKPEEGAAAPAEGGDEAKVEGGAEEVKTEGGEEKAEGGEEEKGGAAGGGTVTQHANEIWTSFKKRVIPKSKRANTECAPSAEDDAAAAAAGEDGDEGKDGKSAKAKRSHFGRAVSLKNFILRKGKSTSVDMGEGAKEEEEEVEEAAAATEEGDAAEEAATPAADGEVVATEETNDKPEAEKTPVAAAPQAEGDAAPKEVEKTPSDAPVTNGENGCTNGTGEENATHNHQEEEEEKTTGAGSPVKKSKEAGGAKDGNAKIINTTAPVNSDKKAGNV